jgi:hypothetical protein
MNFAVVLRSLAVAALGLTLVACEHHQQKLVLSQKSPVELRAMQSRAFDTADRNKALRTVIATLQDLGYTIDKVESEAATVTGTKLSVLRLTAAVYPRGEKQLIVRSNAQVKLHAGNLTENQVDDPIFYQQLFFEPLAKAMFLTALQIEDKDEAPVPMPAPAPPAAAPPAGSAPPPTPR